MKSTISTSETNSTAGQAPAAPKDDPIAAKAAALEKQEKQEIAEYNAILAADLSFSKAVVASGFNVLCRLAKDHGASVDKFGYPSLSAYRRLVNAAAIRAVTHKQFDTLCSIVRQSVGTNPDAKMTDAEIKDGREKCIRNTGKGATGKSSMSLALKAPKAWNITLGE